MGSQRQTKRGIWWQRQNWNWVTSSQRIWRLPANHSKIGRGQEGLHYSFHREHLLLIYWFWTSRSQIWETRTSCCVGGVLCYGSTRKLIYKVFYCPYCFHAVSGRWDLGSEHSPSSHCSLFPMLTQNSISGIAYMIAHKEQVSIPSAHKGFRTDKYIQRVFSHKRPNECLHITTVSSIYTAFELLWVCVLFAS